MPELVVYVGMANTKPLVQIACFCENLLEDADDVISAIRIVDTYYLEASGAKLPEGVKPALELTGVIGLKSGDLKGEYSIGLVMRAPSKEPKELSPPGGWPIVLEGGAHGFNVKMKFRLSLSPSEMGLYWFDVTFGGEVLTSIPLNLVMGKKPERPAA